ncbi:hypothetical protein HanPI659440_Chr03g0111191 [Helianthus annuus]|nr:hypothetical protein HanPI659440_Chr03g0111191 [Helianthus annuus]
MVANFATVTGFVGLWLRQSCCDRFATACLLKFAIIFRLTALRKFVTVFRGRKMFFLLPFLPFFNLLITSLLKFTHHQIFTII